MSVANVQISNRCTKWVCRHPDHVIALLHWPASPSFPTLQLTRSALVELRTESEFLTHGQAHPSVPTPRQRQGHCRKGAARGVEIKSFTSLPRLPSPTYHYQLVQGKSNAPTRNTCSRAGRRARHGYFHFPPHDSQFDSQAEQKSTRPCPLGRGKSGDAKGLVQACCAAMS